MYYLYHCFSCCSCPVRTAFVASDSLPALNEASHSTRLNATRSFSHRARTSQEPTERGHSRKSQTRADTSIHSKAPAQETREERARRRESGSRFSAKGLRRSVWNFEECRRWYGSSFGRPTCKLLHRPVKSTSLASSIESHRPLILRGFNSTSSVLRSKSTKHKMRDG